MRTVTIRINYGGFIGADKIVQFEVEDGASNLDIERMAEEKFKEEVLNDCDYDITDIEAPEDDDNDPFSDDKDE